MKKKLLLFSEINSISDSQENSFLIKMRALTYFSLLLCVYILVAYA